MRMRISILRKRKPRKLIVNRKIVMNNIFSYIFICEGSLEQLSLKEGSHTFSTRLEMLCLISYLRSPVDGVMSL